MRLYKEKPDAYPSGYVKNNLKPSEIFLSECCVTTNKGHWWVRHTNENWEEMTYSTANAAMKQHWKGGPHHITGKDIDQFMEDGIAPIVRDTMRVPTSTAQVIEFQGSTYLNTWRNTIMVGNDVALRDPILRQYLHLFLRVLRESLCDRPDSKSLDEMIAVAHGDDPDELAFRFLMNWLAAPIQRPGINLQTNLWLLGELGGAGKGTLYLVMKYIYGADNATLLQGDEVKQGGWTDSIAGKLFVSVNEINPDSKFDWNGFIKQNSTDDFLQIRKRNNDSHPVINFGNWMVTTNKESLPSGCLDAFDRRNAMFATTSDENKVKLASEFRGWMENVDNDDDVEKVLAGFTYLLERQKVDYKLLAKAPDTPIKQEIQDASSRETKGVYWLKDDEDYPRDQWLPAKDYLQYYKRYNDNVTITPAWFGGILSKLHRKGHIERDQRYKTGPSLWRVSSEKFPNARQQHPSGGKTGTGNLLALIPKKSV